MICDKKQHAVKNKEKKKERTSHVTNNNEQSTLLTQGCGEHFAVATSNLLLMNWARETLSR